MNKRTTAITFAAIILAMFSIGLLVASMNNNQPATNVKISVYKSPSCGCCNSWITHLEQNGFQVTSYNTNGINEIKQNKGVPKQLVSCHTAVVNGYIIEGHVPAADIHQLLETKPRIKGLAVPGMPIGSPGMEQGDRKDPYHVLTFNEQGQTGIFSSYQ